MAISAAIFGALGATRRDFSYKEFILNSNPVAFWPLDEISGSTFNDISGNGLHLPINANVSMGGDSLIGNSQKSAIFNGSSPLSVSAGLIIPYGNSARTVEGWFITTKAAGAGAISFFGYGANNSRQTFNTRTAKTSDSVTPVERSFVHWNYGDDMNATAGVAWNNGVSHHIAVTYNGGGSNKLYLDGVLIGTRTLSGSLATPSGSTFFVGGNTQVSSSSDFPFQGRMQNVAVYNRELSISEIQDRFNRKVA